MSFQSPLSATPPRGAAAPVGSSDLGRAGRHWESWSLRALLVAVVAYHLVQHNGPGATVAALGLATTLIPLLITRLSGWHVPRLLELTFVLAMFLQYVSESFKLFELLTYWDKIVHPAEIFLAAGVASYLLLGYRDCHQLEIPDELAAAGAMLFGMTLGATWELVEFALDWFGNANLQKSNADTLTDILTNDAGAIFGTLLAFWLYRHRTDERQRRAFGELAEWLTGRLVTLFTRHGVLVGVIVALLVGAVITAGWLVDRAPPPVAPPPAPPAGFWRFVPPESLTAPPAALLGFWRPGEQGTCRVNPEQPPPGSEKMGLLLLTSGTGFDAGYAASTRYYLQRPPLGAGTAMEAGLAFGVRGPDDFYLLKASALHDALILGRYLHGHWRDMREERLRIHGDEWHELGLTVRGDQVAAFSDGRPVFQESGVLETAGGLGLWARVTSAGCFSEAQAAPV